MFVSFKRVERSFSTFIFFYKLGKISSNIGLTFFSIERVQHKRSYSKK